MSSILPPTTTADKPVIDPTLPVLERVRLSVAWATRQLRGAPYIPIDPALPSDEWWFEMRRRVTEAEAAGHFGMEVAR
jgi:hypothetical protein